MDENTTQSDTSPIRFHKPVLVEEVLTYLAPKPGKTYLDVTFGSGGHTRALLEREPECTVVAMDWDSAALETYGPALQAEFGNRLRLLWGNFALLYRIIKREKIGPFDGILADFGTSQIQLKERPGFSFYHDTPLDMRMSPSHQTVTAEHVVNKSTEQKLTEIFRQLGQESYAKQIARRIVEERRKHYIKTTGQLAKIVEQVVSRNGARGHLHPATKVFQALRIYINHELENITAFLPVAFELLSPKGRLVCISFHSLEDRLVKQFFNDKEVAGLATVVTPKVVVAGEQEVFENASARSARLRALERV